MTFYLIGFVVAMTFLSSTATQSDRPANPFVVLKDSMIMGHDNFASRNWKAGIGGAVQYRHTKSLAVRFDVATSQDGQRVYFSVSRGF